LEERFQLRRGIGGHDVGEYVDPAMEGVGGERKSTADHRPCTTAGLSLTVPHVALDESCARYNAMNDRRASLPTKNMSMEQQQRMAQAGLLTKRD
jgi:hypothetical protein